MVITKFLESLDISKNSIRHLVFGFAKDGEGRIDTNFFGGYRWFSVGLNCKNKIYLHIYFISTEYNVYKLDYIICNVGDDTGEYGYGPRFVYEKFNTIQELYDWMMYNNLFDELLLNEEGDINSFNINFNVDVKERLMLKK